MNLKQTRQWCATAHGEQKYGKHPYKYHLQRVERVALRFGIRDRAFRQACWGHDVLEDVKGVTREDLQTAGFEDEAVSLCFAVTDEPGATRKERKSKTYPKIRSTPRAVTLKLCDRIANVEESIATASEQLGKYRAEQEEFKRQLFDQSDTEAAPLWRHLDHLFASN